MKIKGLATSWAVLLLIQGSDGHKMHQQQKGIFDAMEAKLQEKEKMAAVKEFKHQKNLIKANKQAAIIASGQVDESLTSGLMTSPQGSLDDELQQGIEKLQQIPIQQLAGVNSESKHKSAKIAQTMALERQYQQKLVQAQIAAEKEEESRDDFEGFGSITAMVQNKDKLIEKTLEDPTFRAQQLAQKKAEETKQKLIQAAKDKKARAEKEAEDKKKKELLTAAKAKMEAALNKSQPKKQTSLQSLVVAKTMAKESSKTTSETVSQSTYQKAIDSVLHTKKETPKIKVVLPPKPINLPQKKDPIVAADSVAENADEEQGFIGKFQKKISEADKLKKDNEETYAKIMAEQRGQPYSKDAPKHKGMLARAMEKDQMAQAAQEAQEKESLMQEALNDPSFKQQINALKARGGL